MLHVVSLFFLEVFGLVSVDGVSCESLYFWIICHILSLITCPVLLTISWTFQEILILPLDKVFQNQNNMRR